MTAPIERAMYTSSRYRPTPGSVFSVKSIWPMPRMKNAPAELLPETAEPLFEIRFGVYMPRSFVDTMPRSARPCAVNAVTEIGVSCRLSSRLRAVTTTSSSAPVTTLT